MEIYNHGFCTLACRSLIESELGARYALERQIGHQALNGVGAAYIHKAEYLDERRAMVGGLFG